MVKVVAVLWWGGKGGTVLRRSLGGALKRRGRREQPRPRCNHPGGGSGGGRGHWQRPPRRRLLLWSVSSLPLTPLCSCPLSMGGRSCVITVVTDVGGRACGRVGGGRLGRAGGRADGERRVAQLSGSASALLAVGSPLFTRAFPRPPLAPHDREGSHRAVMADVAIRMYVQYKQTMWPTWADGLADGRAWTRSGSQTQGLIFPLLWDDVGRHHRAPPPPPLRHAGPHRSRKKSAYTSPLASSPPSHFPPHPTLRPRSAAYIRQVVSSISYTLSPSSVAGAVSLCYPLLFRATTAASALWSCTHRARGLHTNARGEGGAGEGGAGSKRAGGTEDGQGRGQTFGRGGVWRPRPRHPSTPRAVRAVSRSRSEAAFFGGRVLPRDGGCQAGMVRLSPEAPRGASHALAQTLLAPTPRPRLADRQPERNPPRCPCTVTCAH